MSEVDSSLSGEYIFSAQPPSVEQLLPPSPDQQLYNIYTDRIGDFGGFRQRPFKEARSDFIKTLHEADDSADIEFIRTMIYQLVTPEGYANFRDELKSYWDAHGLEQDLETYSNCFVSNHRFFSDIPTEAVAVRDMRQNDPYAASRNLLVDARMIPGMEIDLFNDGNYAPVTPMLSLIARQVQTVPKVPENATEAMIAQRRIWNDDAKGILEHATSSAGNIIYMAASGSHDEVSSDGKRLTMKSINPETAKLLCNPRLKVIPIFFSCNSFGQKGVQPAVPKFHLLEPRVLQSPEDAVKVMQELSEAGTELLSEEFSKGVRYEVSFRENMRRAGKLLTHKAARDSGDTPSY